MSKQKSCRDNMPIYPGFMEKLLEIQKLCKKGNDYVLGGLIWDDSIVKDIKKCKYPSKYFMAVIVATQIFGDYICNIPLIVPNVKKFKFIAFPPTSLIVLDALWKQGSNKRYRHRKKFLYSEHSGVLDVRNNQIDKVIVLSNTTRIDPSDQEIYLPNNTDTFGEYHYMFHTHPNNGKWGGRLKSGIVYEFPSASDLFNFTSYYDNGKTQASVIVSPEGIYVIRAIKYVKRFNLDPSLYSDFNRTIDRIEAKAYAALGGTIKSAADFHHHISSNTRYVHMLNKYLKKYNIYLEYYPRIFVNGEWILRPIYLPYVKS